MLIVRSDQKDFMKLYEKENPYDDKKLVLTGEKYYFVYTHYKDYNVLEACPGSYEHRISYGPRFFFDEDMEEIFKSKLFQDMIAEKTEKWKDYCDTDYIDFLMEFDVRDYDNRFTYMALAYIYVPDDTGSGAVYLKKSSDLPIFSNEEKTIFSTVANDEFSVNIRVNANYIDFTPNGPEYYITEKTT